MRRLLTIREYCDAYGDRRTKTYELIAAGELEAVKDGARTKITYESAERRAASLPRFKPAGALARATEAASAKAGALRENPEAGPDGARIDAAMQRREHTDG